MFRCLSIFFWSFYVFFLFTQTEDDKGGNFFLGFEASLFRPSMKHAEFYAGYPQNVNSLSYVLDNPYWYQEIKNLFDENVHRDSFSLLDYPYPMKYDLAFMPGLNFRYRWSNEFYLSFYASVVRLKAVGLTTFEVFPPFVGELHSYVYLPIEGVERRSFFSLCFTYFFSSHANASWFAELGALLVNTRVLSHRLYVFDKYYNLQDLYGVPYVPNAGLTEIEIYQGGTSPGVCFSIGYSWKLGARSCLDIFYQGALHSVKLPQYPYVGYHQKLGVKFFTHFYFNS
ncbi:MAG: hypothetical protein N2Z72_02675 [Bacteroidales bacterium]|nr:hypothetical protein [Bacteroidales bacterium]